ncbi:hypothetical protein [Hwanghaeella sp.]|uniref:hypothetical protein n=1 Tax=Hwanghaeella sp. TaxID=2605943 RepID=UPI003CCBBA3D
MSTTCTHCNGTGEIARRTTFPMSYVGPGPVPEDALSVVAATCDECRGTGRIEAAAARKQ